MAEIKCIDPSVDTAEKVLWRCMAEAQSLIVVRSQSNDDSPLLCLAAGIIERLTDAFDVYHTELLRHGVPSLDEQMGEDLQ